MGEYFIEYAGLFSKKGNILYPSASINSKQMLNHRHMTQYECMFIINPSIGEKEIASAVALIKENIEKAGKITKEDLWGEKKMAYKIKGSSRGYYGLLDVEIDGKQIKTMNNIFNLNGNIWRYMFVKKED